MTKEEATEELQSAIASVLGEVETWVRRDDDTDKTFLRFKIEDQVLLLRLRTWSLRTFIPIDEILSILVPVYRSQIRHKRRCGTLGVSLRALLSQKSFQVLEKEIKRRYPDDEHLMYWRDVERTTQVARELHVKYKGANREEELDFLEADSTEAWVADYKDMLDTQIKDFESVALRKHKPFRNMPWLK